MKGRGLMDLRLRNLGIKLEYGKNKHWEACMYQ